MTQQDPKPSIETMLAGTPLLAFLQELMMIADAEIIDDLPPSEEGDIVLGPMTLFEKRLNAWYDRRKDEVKKSISTACGACIDRQCGSSDIPHPCDVLRRFDEETDTRFELMWQSIGARYPDAQGYALCKGFQAVDASNRQAQAPHVGIKFVFLNDVSELPAALAAFSAEVSSGKKPH